MAENKGGNGGNVIFIAGRGAKGTRCRFPQDGSIIFKRADDTEALRFDPDGSILVEGRKAENDRTVIDSFRRWLRHAVSVSEGNATIGPGKAG